MKTRFDILIKFVTQVGHFLLAIRVILILRVDFIATHSRLCLEISRVMSIFNEFG